MSLLSQLNAWHRLFRTEHALLTYFGVLVGVLLFAGNRAAEIVQFGFVWLPLAAALGPALITAGAFALNDYHGVETDRINKRKDRPIVSGEINRGHALIAAVILIFLGLLLSFEFGNLGGFLLALVFALLAFAYDPVLKKLPLVGNLYIAFSMAAPFLYGALAAQLWFISPDFSIMPIPPIVWLLTPIAFLAGVGRELLKTLADVKGDKAIGAKTLPMVIGARNTTYFAGLLFIFAILLSLIPLSSSLNFLYAVPIALCDVLLLFSATQAIKSPGNVTVLRRARNYTLAAMGCGVMAFLALGLAS